MFFSASCFADVQVVILLEDRMKFAMLDFSMSSVSAMIATVATTALIAMVALFAMIDFQ